MPPSRSLAAIRRPATPSAMPARQSRPSCGRAQPVARVGQRQHGQHQGRVLDGPRHRAEVGHRAERRQRPGRHSPEGRLQPDDAAEGGRDADRPAAVRAEVERPHAESRRDRRAAARAAGGAARVPRVARDLAQRVVGHRLPAELGRGGLAEQHRAGLAQPRGRGRVLSVRRGTGRRPAAAPGREAAHQDDVLDRRPARRRAAAAGSPRAQRASDARAAARAPS